MSTFTTVLLGIIGLIGLVPALVVALIRRRANRDIKVLEAISNAIKDIMVSTTVDQLMAVVSAWLVFARNNTNSPYIIQYCQEIGILAESKMKILILEEKKG